MSANHEKVEALFLQALQYSLSERAAFLAGACGEDAELRSKLEELLQAQDQAGPFLPEAPKATAVPVTAVTEQPGDTIGRYKLREKVGEGGCGVVYVAEQEAPVRRRVALKVIKPGMDTQQVIARFEAERQALALMDHPNIAKVLDGGTTDTGRPYFVMELVRGIRITDYCDQSNLTTSDRLDLFIQVCQAVQHAHQKGIIHRDLKPSNILVTLHDGVPVPKVIDFGIAKATEGRLTEATVYTELHQFMGTPAYMSPEQAEMSGLDIDTRSDIYSLGVLLYQLLTGKTPFDGKELLAQGIDEMRRTIREREPMRPSTRLANLQHDELTTTAKRRSADAPRLIHLLKGDLDWIVMKCLEKDRQRRYETANGLAMDIERYLGNEPVLARPPSAAYRFQKLVRRNKGAFAATGCVVTALIVGLALAVWQYAEKSLAYRKVVAAEKEQSRLLRLAETKEAKSKQVTGFLKDMLNGVGSSSARGRDTTMLREILNATASRLDIELKHQPEVEAELRLIMGNVHLDLGDPQAAEKMNRRALELRRKLHGPESRGVAECLSQLATTHIGNGRNSEAETSAREAVAILKQFPGPDPGEDLLLADALSQLASALLHQRKNGTEAEALARQALSIRRKVRGEDGLDTADSLAGVADALKQQGKYVEAEVLNRQALAIYRKRFGAADHPRVASELLDLGFDLHFQDRNEEAVALFRESLDMERKLRGQEHPQVATALHALAEALSGEGKHAEAQAAHLEAIVLRRKLLGPEHPDTLRSMHDLAHVFERMGDTNQSLRLHEECLSGYERTRNSTNFTLLEVKDHLELLQSRGQPEKKLRVLEESLARWRAAAGPFDYYTLLAMDKLAVAYPSNQLDKARPLLEEALAAHQKQDGPASERTLTTAQHLAVTYMEMGLKQQAIQLWEQTLAGATGKLSPTNSVLMTVMNQLGYGYQSVGQFDRATSVFKEVLAARRSAFGPNHPQSLSGLKRLAEGYDASAQIEQALPLFEEHLARCRVALGSDHADTLAAMRNVSIRLDFTGQLQKAETLVRETLRIRDAGGESGSSSELSTDLATLCNVLSQQQRYEEAEPVCRRCLAIRQQPGGGSAWSLANAKSLLGGVLLGQKKLADAEPLLLAAYAGMKESQANSFWSRVRMKETLQRLVRLYEAWPKPDQAAEWNRALATFEEGKAVRSQ